MSLPEFIREVGEDAIKQGTGCDRHLPATWLRGAWPGKKNRKALAEFAASKGYTLILEEAI